MSTWMPKRDQCVYTACYCEENIWKLCELWQQNDPDHLKHLYPTFISNSHRKIPIWKQKSATNSEHPVIWDYHVILIDKSSSPAVLYDFDTTLSFLVSAADYIDQSIGSETRMARKYHRMFRVIPAQEYLRVFASDRSHMLKADKVTYQSPPPSYPPIRSETSTNNIKEFIDMNPTSGSGTVMNLATFRQFLSV